MGVFNNFGEYNAKEEAIRRAALVKEFLDSDEIHLLMLDKENQIKEEGENIILTVKVKKCSGAGSSYSADCPNCGKIKFLSSELNTMTAICNKCHCVFNLEK